MDILRFIKIKKMDVWDYARYKYQFSFIDVIKYETNIMYEEFIFADKNEEELKCLDYYYPAIVCSIRTIELFFLMAVSIKTTKDEDKKMESQKIYFSGLLKLFSKYWGAENEKLSDNLEKINKIRNDFLYHPKASKLKKETFDFLINNPTELKKIITGKRFELRKQLYKKKYLELEKLKNEIIQSTIHYIKSTIEDGFNPKATAVRYK